MNRKVFPIIFLPLVFFISCTLLSTAWAVKTAPRITDREIVEKLAQLEAGQKALRAEMKAGQQALNKRIDDLCAEMKAGQKALRSEMKAGQESIRSEMRSGQAALNQRIDDLSSTMRTMFSALIVLIVGIFAYITWDRRTMIKPILERLDRLEKQETSLAGRMQQALREYAKHNPQFAEILKHFSLL